MGRWHESDCCVRMWLSTVEVLYGLKIEPVISKLANSHSTKQGLHIMCLPASLPQPLGLGPRIVSELVAGRNDRKTAAGPYKRFCPPPAPATGTYYATDCRI